jgi:hypothetical protein
MYMYRIENDQNDRYLYEFIIVSTAIPKLELLVLDIPVSPLCLFYAFRTVDLVRS